MEIVTWSLQKHVIINVKEQKESKQWLEYPPLSLRLGARLEHLSAGMSTRCLARAIARLSNCCSAKLILALLGLWPTDCFPFGPMEDKVKTWTFLQEDPL